MEQYSEIVRSFQISLKELFSENGLDLLTLGHRIKSSEAIARKMARYGVVNDIVGFRAIVRTEQDCYRASDIVAAAYQVIPGRIRDYIQVPKNKAGYRAIHIDLVFDEQVLELQLRTPEMDDFAHELKKKFGDYYWYRPEFS